MPLDAKTLLSQLNSLGVGSGDGLFVNGSMRAVGRVECGAPTIIEALLKVIGAGGLLAMPSFTEDAVLTGPPPRTDAEY